MAELQRVEPSIRDKVVQRIRSDIVSGRAPAGGMYSVPSLASEIGVSTTPVREALLELSHNGLLTPVRNRGFRVEATSLADLRHIFVLREMVERHAMVTLASKRLVDTAEVRSLADAVAEAVAREDVRGYIETDRSFHKAMTERAGIPMLTRIVMELRDAMRLYGIESAAGRERQVKSVAEHYQLIEMAAAGDTTGIADLISRHIMDWEPVFTAALSERLR